MADFGIPMPHLQHDVIGMACEPQLPVISDSTPVRPVAKLHNNQTMDDHISTVQSDSSRGLLRVNDSNTERGSAIKVEAKFHSNEDIGYERHKGFEKHQIADKHSRSENTKD